MEPDPPVNPIGGHEPTERLVVACGGCGASLLPRANFCAECGRHVADLRAGGPGVAEPRAGTALGATQSFMAQGGPPHAARIADDRMTSSRRAWLGRVVDGRYRVLECIGHGGMGVIYRVEHIRLGKHAAMKVLHDDLAGRRDIVSRFEREAHAVSRLTHPSTIAVFDFGSERGQLYLVMEWVRGVDLGHLVAREGRLPWQRAVPLFTQICASLGEAHGMGIVHRDLKPENILVTRDANHRDFVKVLDFGLAALLERDPTLPVGEAAFATDSNEIVGTPYFMAPEQIRGTPVDGRTDIYSLGALMYFVLTGRHPFAGDNALAVLSAHLNAPVPRVPGAQAPPELEALIAQCMAKDAARRPQRIEDVSGVLGRLLATPGLLPGNPGAFSPSSASGMERAASAASSASAASVAGAASAASVALANSSWQLQRSDLDAFERSLVRRAWAMRAALVAVLAAVAAGGWYALIVRDRPLPPATAEREPNDTLAQATRIAVSVPIGGHLGRRRSLTQGDADVFLAELPPGQAAYEISVVPPPNVDAALRLYTHDGQLLAQTNVGGVGAPEWLGPRRLSGVAVIELLSMTADGARPTENVSDPYALAITPSSAGASAGASAEVIAVEPDDAASDATPIRSGAATGAFDGADDADWLRFDGAAGTYRLTVTSEVPVSLRVDGKEVVLDDQRGAALALVPGTMLQLEPARAASRGWTAASQAWRDLTVRTAAVTWTLSLRAP